MKRTKTVLNLSRYPDDVAAFLSGADIYDSSCSGEARVYFIDRDQGYYLKQAASGLLATEQMMHGYFHSIGLTSAIALYRHDDDWDYLITERVPGEDCTTRMYLDDPKRLCDTIAASLRQLHERTFADCPLRDRIARYRRAVLDGHERGKYEHDLFEGIWTFPSVQAAWEAAEEGLGSLEQNVLMHGDYCLPNIILADWKLSGYIDLINGGIGDRHIDVLWGIWTLRYNLGTAQYTERFLDAYGREMLDLGKLRCIAAMEMIGC